MNPYSHIVIASKLESIINPKDRQEYYWGAIAPDIRYLASMQRQQTHISSQKIVGFISQYPQHKSFLQGYLVHCLTDEIELAQIFSLNFPFSILNRKISRQQLAVIFELYYFENEKINVTFSNLHNEFLNALGLNEVLSKKFSQSISQYVFSSPPESRLSDLFELMGLENDSRAGKYLSAAKSFQENWLLKNALFFKIRTGRMNEKIVSKVLSLYQQCNV